MMLFIWDWILCWASPSTSPSLAQALTNRILWVPHGDCLEVLGPWVGGLGFELWTTVCWLPLGVSWVRKKKDSFSLPCPILASADVICYMQCKQQFEFTCNLLLRNQCSCRFRCLVIYNVSSTGFML